jgi:3D (Asp-Asp-Asp) domain-containing protein
MGIKLFAITFAFIFLSAASLFAREESILARITVYWPGEGQLRACSNGARLRAGHVAVDPKRIPYGSHVIFPDAECVAVDSGPGVVNRTAARACARTAAQRAAIVIDRFFESKAAALSWAGDHPQYMTVRVQSGNSARHIAETMTADGTAKAGLPAADSAKEGAAGKVSTNAAKNPPTKRRNREASLPEFDSTKIELHLPLDSFLRSVRRT